MQHLQHKCSLCRQRSVEVRFHFFMFRAMLEFDEIEPHLWEHRFRLDSMAVWRQSCSLICLFDGAAATNLVELAEPLSLRIQSRK